MSTDEVINAYELLGIEIEATEPEIKSAYRKLSLKVHPDRNPNNPDAARLFHELNQAYELLLDPLRRLVLDTKLRQKRARAERYKAYDTKRKNMLEELEERERAFKKAKLDKHQEEIKMQRETERIKEEGRKLREQREQELLTRQQEQARAAKEDDEPPELNPLDTTVRLKYSLTAHPTLTTPESITQLLSQFGPVDADSIVISLKAPKKSTTKQPKTGTALAPFKQIGDAFAAVCASGLAERGLEGVDIAWVTGTEPQIIGWLKRMGKLGIPRIQKEQTSSSSSALHPGSPNHKNDAKNRTDLLNNQSTSSSGFSTFPSTFPILSSTETKPPEPPTTAGIDYESLTLMRLRQAERERLEREIREREAQED